MSVARSVRLGMTLAETLVAIAVIGFLLAFLAPALGRARAQARRTACLANLRALHLAVEQYKHDHDALLPYAGRAIVVEFGWTQPLDQLVGYLAVPLPRYDQAADTTITGPPFVCPSDPSSGEKLGCSYVYTPAETMEAQGQSAITRWFRETPTLPLFWDTYASHSFSPNPPGGLEYHRGRNAVLADGSLGWMVELVRPLSLRRE